MNRILGFSSNAIALVGIIVATILVVIVGVIMMGSSAIQALMVPGLKFDGIPVLALLITIIVLLLAILVILLVLFWCCCKRTPGKDGSVSSLPPDVLAVLIPALPLLRDLPNLLSQLGITIYQCGNGLQWVQGRIDAVSHGFGSVASAIGQAPSLSIPQMTGGLGAWAVNPVEPLLVLKSVTEIADDLATAATNIYPVTPSGTPPTIPLGATLGSKTAGEIGEHMIQTGKKLAGTAHALGASNPVPPQELLLPP